MLHSPLNGRIILNAINGKPGTTSEVAKPLRDRFNLYGVKRDESSLSCSLIPHVLVLM